MNKETPNRLQSDLITGPQELRCDSVQGDVPFANGFSELMISNCQGLEKTGNEERDQRYTAGLEGEEGVVVVVTRQAENIQPLTGTCPELCGERTDKSSACDLHSLSIMQNGSPESNANMLSDSEHGSERLPVQNSLPAPSLTDAVPPKAEASSTVGYEGSNLGIKEVVSGSDAQLSVTKVSDINRCVSQVPATTCSSRGDVAASASPASVAANRSDVASATGTSVAYIQSNDVPSDSGKSLALTQSDVLTSSRCTLVSAASSDTVTGIPNTADRAYGTDIAVNTPVPEVTSKFSDITICASNTPVPVSRANVVSRATSDPVVSSCERQLPENLPPVVKEFFGQSSVHRSSTGDESLMHDRPSGNLKQRYSDIPVLSKDHYPGNLDHDSHSCIELSHDSESLKKLLMDEKVKGDVSSDVYPIPSAASCVAVVSAADSRNESVLQERGLSEDPLLKKRYDRRSVTSISSDSRVETRSDLPPISPGCIVMSQSTEKITGRPNARMQFFPSAGVVRSSRSQENYFDSGDITCVDIDLDDNIASSVDALHYDTSSMASLDSMGIPDWPIDGSESDLYLQTDDKCFRGLVCPEPDRTSLPATLTTTTTVTCSSLPAIKNGLPESGLQMKSAAPALASQPKLPASLVSRSEDQRSNRAHGIALCISAAEIEDAFELQSHSTCTDVTTSVIPALSSDDTKPSILSQKNATVSATAQVLSGATHKELPVEYCPKSSDSKLASASIDSVDDDDDDDETEEEHEDVDRSDDFDFMLRDETFFRQPTKDVDRPSAARLAKRLFYLHGFKKSDVSRHLSKKNSFSQLVGEEYLKYFDFAGEPLDGALRRFMKHMTIYGETQDRERLLAHFSCRYHLCNPGTFKSEDCCHTLACALLLLNNDLNGQNIGRKITLPEFVSNLADMNDGEQFPKDLLKSLYLSIKNQPLEFEAEEVHDVSGSSAGSAVTSQAAAPTQSRFISYNPFYEIPSPSNAVEFKKGYVMRKCCLEPDGRKTPLGKRGWKMFYATLHDMVLHLHIDEHGFKRNQHYTSASNAIHIHHSLATKATDYQKKNHVFRLQTADMAQYLIQTSDSKECQEWIDAINFVAASYSAPSPISSITSQKRFQRPLLPSTYTRLNLREQINHHEKMIVEFDRELVEHRKNPPEKGAKTRLIQDYCRKENHLKFELKRYKTYCRLLQYKVSTFPELEPSLAEIAIGEVDEPTVSGSPVELLFDGRGPKFFQSASNDSPPQSPDRLQS